VFLDASAIVAILAGEEERHLLLGKIESAETVLTSPIAIYEATAAFARILGEDFNNASIGLQELIEQTSIKIIDINEQIGAAAIAAFVKFGKGRHEAKLNMGDCFSYACAKAHRVPLLFKGNDFIHTDIRLA
jgi:ribonuclease VapC